MADVIVSKIQHRRGLRRDLPQPLDPGELGYCIDTRQMFIGAEAHTDNPDALNSISILLYDLSTSSSMTANSIISVNLKQFDLGEYESETEARDALIVISELEDVKQLRTVVIGTNSVSGNDIFRGYAGYLPTDDISENGETLYDASACDFKRGSLDLQLSPNYTYNLDDSYAIVELVNLLSSEDVVEDVVEDDDEERYELVRTQQNVEVLTESTDIEKLAHPRVEIKIPAQTTEQVLEYSVDTADSFVVEYSITTNDADVPYRRVGTFTVVVDVTGAEASLLDNYSLIGNQPDNYTTDLIAEYDSVYKKVIIKSVPYNFENPDKPDLKLVFNTNTRKWVSFA